MKKVFLSFVTFALVASSGISLNAWGRGTIVETVTMVNGAPLKRYSVGQTNSRAGEEQFREDERNLQPDVDRLNAEATAEHEAAVKANGWLKTTLSKLIKKPTTTTTTNVVASTRPCDAIPVETLRQRRGLNLTVAAPVGAPAPADSTPAPAANTSASTDSSASAPATPHQDGSDDTVTVTDRIAENITVPTPTAQQQANANAELQAAVAKAAEEAKLSKIAASMPFGVKVIAATPPVVLAGLATNHKYPTFIPTALAAAKSTALPLFNTAAKHGLPLAGAIATQMANSTPAQLAMSAYASAYTPAIAVGGTALAAAIYGYSKLVNRKAPAGLLEKAKAWIRSSKFFAPARFAARHKGKIAATAIAAYLAYHINQGYNNYQTEQSAKQAEWMAQQVTEHGCDTLDVVEARAEQAWNFGQELIDYAKLTCPDPQAEANKTALVLHAGQKALSSLPKTVALPEPVLNPVKPAATMTIEQIGGFMGWFVNLWRK